MSLSARQLRCLDQIARLVKKIQIEAEKQHGAESNGKRRRRTGAALEKMKTEVLAARAKGVAAAKLAEKYGVSQAYIYMIKE